MISKEFSKGGERALTSVQLNCPLRPWIWLSQRPIVFSDKFGNPWGSERLGESLKSVLLRTGQYLCLEDSEG